MARACFELGSRPCRACGLTWKMIIQLHSAYQNLLGGMLYTPICIQYNCIILYTCVCCHASAKLCCVKPADPPVAMFGVYDGHGGARAAQYLAAHLPQHLGNIPDAHNPDALTDSCTLCLLVALFLKNIRILC